MSGVTFYLSTCLHGVHKGNFQFLASTTATLVDGNILGFGLGSKDELKLVVVLLEDEAPTSGGTEPVTVTTAG